MKAKKEVRQILKWIDQVKETDCSFKEILMKVKQDTILLMARLKKPSIRQVKQS